MFDPPKISILANKKDIFTIHSNIQLCHFPIRNIEYNKITKL